MYISILPNVFDKSDLPDIFSNYFNDIIKAIRAEFPTHDTPSASTYTPIEPALQLNNFEPVTHKEIFQIISDSPSKSCELDSIPTKLFKKCLNELLPIITEIINYSLRTGIVPDKFKTAIVKPLIKKPSLDPNCLKNYRPVSNLSFLSKLLERVILKQLLKHIEQANLNENISQLINCSTPPKALSFVFLMI